MNNKTKFAFLPIIICFIVTMSVFGIFFLTLSSSKSSILGPMFFLIVAIYLWLTEFRTRAHKIEILNDKVIVREYFGLGKQKIFELKNLEGFNLSIQPSKSGPYKYIFIIQQGKRIASISEFYHRNYGEMKTAIEERIKNLGLIEYRFKSELREMFK